MSLDEQANNDLATKLELEALFYAPLIAIYNKISEDIQRYYLASRLPPSAYSYVKDFKKFFDDLYSQTSARFSSIMYDQLSVQQSFIDNSQNKIDEFNNINSSSDTDNVTSTNEKDITENYQNTLIEANKNNLSTKDTADLMQNNFLNIANSRYSTILATSVQKSSEGTKSIISNQYNTISTGTTKVWMNMMDDKVREAHVIAGFQEQPISIPFTVGGEQLMYPSDTSLGASLSNIINCRCVAVYKLR